MKYSWYVERCIVLYHLLVCIYSLDIICSTLKLWDYSKAKVCMQLTYSAIIKILLDQYTDTDTIYAMLVDLDYTDKLTDK